MGNSMRLSRTQCHVLFTCSQTTLPNSMSRSFLQTLVIAVCFALMPLARAATIFQAPNSTYVAWEAEDIFSISNNTPTLWAATNDATASGSQALYASGVNQTAAPASFASYLLR